MRIGSFATPQQLGALRSADADFAEFFLSTTITNLDDDAFASLVEAARGWPMRPVRFSGFLPASIPVAGPETDVARQDDYLRQAFTRMRAISGSDEELVVVFGSGRARAIPAGYPRDRALDQLEDFVRRAVAYASDERIVLAVEPLNQRECNVFNSIGEIGAFFADRSLEGAFILADLYHLMEENESMDALTRFGALIRHAHVSEASREVPGSASGTPYPLVEFLGKLRESGYRGDCSIECSWSDFDAQIGAALQYCRDAAAAAGF